jgi:hypothetical protein
MRRLGCLVLLLFEFAFLITLILATRCANYQDVFFGGNVYFTDADCYARMTRVQMCAEHPGLVIRHHDFENYPAGTSPHTTAPLDYLILLLAFILRPLTAHSLELAGALVSPLCGLLAGAFLWWWSGHMKLRYRWILLILYAISPILVQGTELGRPDHQSLVLALLLVAICSEWSWQMSKSKTWGAATGLSWAFGIWVSAYEPLILFAVLLLLSGCFQGWRQLFGHERKTFWICFGVMIALALVVERRVPVFPFLEPPAVILRNWTRMIGELRPVSIWNAIWFRWTGWLLPAVPFLALWAWWKRADGGAVEKFPLVILPGLFLAAVCLTIWQARWAYFSIFLFIQTLVAFLEPIRFRSLVWAVFLISLFPILEDWDEKLWPNEPELARRTEQRSDAVALRELAVTMQSSERRPFLAVWWLSPEITYWSGQPGVAGSSHEAFAGIADSTRFFATNEWDEAREILRIHQVEWVLAYNADRTAQNCSAILDKPVAQHAICYILDRAPAQVSRILALAAQNSGGKLFRVANNR